MSIEALCIPEEKKQYIMMKLSPVLEEVVTEVLTVMPDDPVLFMHKWFCKKVGADGGAGADLAAQNDSLRKSLAAAALEFGSGQGQKQRTQEEEDEEEESDDEMEMSAEEIEAYERQLESRLDNEVKAGGRTSVSAEAYGAYNKMNTDFVAPNFPKSDSVKKELQTLLESCFFLAALKKKEMDTVLGALQEVKLAPGEQVIKLGDYGDFMFIIQDGELDIWKEIDGARKSLAVKKRGEIFGELALLYNTPRNANVSAKDACTVWRLDRESFSQIVKVATIKHRQENEEAIKNISLLSGLDQYQRGQLCDALVHHEFKAGEFVIKQGEKGDHCYFVVTGELVAVKEGMGEVMQYSPTSNQFFGELALLKAIPERAASIKCQTDCELMSLDRKAFSRLLGSLHSILEQVKY